MPRYQVRDGAGLPHAGTVIEVGKIVELPRHVAEDSAVRHLVQEVDAKGKPVDPVPVDDLARFRSHERVSILQERLAAAYASVDQIEQQLAKEEQILVTAVQAVHPPLELKEQ